MLRFNVPQKPRLNPLVEPGINNQNIDNNSKSSIKSLNYQFLSTLNK